MPIHRLLQFSLNRKAVNEITPQRMSRLVPDFWLRLAGISLFSLIAILGDDTFPQPLTGQTFTALALNVSKVALVWHLNRSLIAYLRYELLPHRSLSKRLLVTLLLCVGATAITFSVFDLLRYAVLHGTLADFADKQLPIYLTVGSVSVKMNWLGANLFHGFINALFFLTIYELLFYRQDSSRYREQLVQSEQEREKLRVANLQSQLDVLKSQVNPHFLFNALNSLSALISEDPQQAEVFVNKLSQVYRYVLQVNRVEGPRNDRYAEPGPDPNLTTLTAELQFIDAYYHLLHTRYGTGLSLTVSVDEVHHACQLPPLTLQLLVENAVKHNVVSTKRPLRIAILTDEQGRLVVKNNLQRKATRALSNGVGLSNIVAKYQMLNLPQPSVEESNGQFTVRLPLLACSDEKPVH